MSSTPGNLIDRLTSQVQQQRPNLEALDEYVRLLKSLGIASVDDLIQSLPSLTGKRLIAAIEACGSLKLRQTGPLIVPHIESPDAGVRWHAQAALSAMASRRTYRPLARIATSHHDLEVRYQACYTLSWILDDAAVPILQELYTDCRLPLQVRGQAAEGLGSTLACSDRRNRIFKHIAAALITGLNDEFPEVRFWSAYALGEMRATQAISELERVAAEDTEFCPGWWFVREEASDALGHIRKINVPTRTPLGWTETGEPRLP